MKKWIAPRQGGYRPGWNAAERLGFAQPSAPATVGRPPSGGGGVGDSRRGVPARCAARHPGTTVQCARELHHRGEHTHL